MGCANRDGEEFAESLQRRGMKTGVDEKNAQYIVCNATKQLQPHNILRNFN